MKPQLFMTFASIVSAASFEKRAVPDPNASQGMDVPSVSLMDVRGLLVAIVRLDAVGNASLRMGEIGGILAKNRAGRTRKSNGSR